MRKRKIFLLGIACALLAVGCKKSAGDLNAEDLKQSTMLIEKKGTIKAAMLETFEQPYYDKQELSAYLTSVIGKYNKGEKEGPVVMNSFSVKDGQAGYVFSYQDISHYRALNGVEAEYLSLSEAAGKLPTEFTSLTGTNVSLSEIEEEKDYEKLNVLILNEAYDVLVDGTIKYYSNASKLADDSVHTNEGTSYIIFK